jgi:hypothetical protein
MTEDRTPDVEDEVEAGNGGLMGVVALERSDDFVGQWN